MDEIEIKITECRICGHSSLEPILDFERMSLTGVFLKDGSSAPTAMLELVRCNNCGLAQLHHNYNAANLYGDSYGYESHLNKSMREHLVTKARALESKYLEGVKNPIIVDIASNDGTLLSGYSATKKTLVGIDPLIGVVGDYYPESAQKIKSFFSEKAFTSEFSAKADLVTSLSVLYDLPDPVKFVTDISAILKDDGVWHFEQSYLPTMVDTLSYDTICHEHLLYLTLHDIKNLVDKAGFTIIDASLNSINGGSIAITARKTKLKPAESPFVEFLLQKEISEGYTSSTKLHQFANNAHQHRDRLKKLLLDYQRHGYNIIGLGASTKGNVLLQWLGLSSEIISEIGDINPRKFGMQTPGTCIGITEESGLLQAVQAKTLALVLPWHFRAGIVANSQSYISNGGTLLFPLPNIEAVSI